MTKLIAHAIAPIAEWLFRREWLALKDKLKLIYQYHQQEYESRPSILLQSLLISGEDHRFFTHGGFDIIAFCRVIWRGTILGQKEGASTIEMQIVRILTERYERTITRKIRETALATLLTQIAPKSELPSIYIRIGYYGWKMNGFRAACNHLGLDPRLIKQEDAAALIASLKYPQSHYISDHRRNQIKRRAEHLLMLHRRHLLNGTYVGLLERGDYATV